MRPDWRAKKWSWISPGATIDEAHRDLRPGFPGNWLGLVPPRLQVTSVAKLEHGKERSSKRGSSAGLILTEPVSFEESVEINNATGRIMASRRAIEAVRSLESDIRETGLEGESKFFRRDGGDDAVATSVCEG
jgi:hypothetical protein